MSDIEAGHIYKVMYHVPTLAEAPEFTYGDVFSGLASALGNAGIPCTYGVTTDSNQRPYVSFPWCGAEPAISYTKRASDTIIAQSGTCNVTWIYRNSQDKIVTGNIVSSGGGVYNGSKIGSGLMHGDAIYPGDTICVEVNTMAYDVADFYTIAVMVFTSNISSSWETYPDTLCIYPKSIVYSGVGIMQSNSIDVFSVADDGYGHVSTFTIPQSAYNDTKKIDLYQMHFSNIETKLYGAYSKCDRFALGNALYPPYVLMDDPSVGAVIPNVLKADGHVYGAILLSKHETYSKTATLYRIS